MGKVEEVQLHGGQYEQQRRQQDAEGSRSSAILCERCSMRLCRIGREFSPRCAVVGIFSLTVFLPVLFWTLPLHSIQAGFDAKDAIKLRATIQAYFRLPKPVSELVPRVGRLEYDIYNEIGVPNSKVAILSLHQPSASNWTNVVFGILSDPIDVSINPVSLSLLKSSLVALFVQESNLTLTRIFGQPSSFGILKFAGGITLIPEQSAGIWDIPQVLFNFTLNNSIQQIKDNFADLKEQLKLGLHLRSYENIYMLVTNRIGSTRDPPVTVQASVKSYTGIPLPQRLRQLAQTITGSPVENLGLDNSVFGQVKEISISSFLNNTLHATPPSPSPAPAPAPGQDDYADPPSAPYTDLSPSYPPAASSPDIHHQFASSPSDDSYSFPPSPENPQNSVPPISSVAPSIVDAHAPHPSPHCGSALVPSPSHTFNYDSAAPSSFSADAPGSYPPSLGSTPSLSPYLPPLPVVCYDSRTRLDTESGKKSASPPHASPTISAFPSWQYKRRFRVADLRKATYIHITSVRELTGQSQRGGRPLLYNATKQEV